MSESLTSALDKKKPALGIDDGTFTLVAARRDADGNIQYKHEINGYMEIPINSKTEIMLNLIKKQAPVYIPEGGKSAFLMGKKGRKVALSMSSMFSRDADGDGTSVFRRTMKDGILSVRDNKQSFHLLATMLRSLAQPLPSDRCAIAFAYPGVPVNNKNLDPNYHKSVVEKILSDVDGKKPDAFGVNEAQAIIFAECEEEGYTGLAFSFGAGMTNVCFCIMGYPVFTFSYVGGGDWIDEKSAIASGTDPVVINDIKMGDEENGVPGIDLTEEPYGENEHITRAIKTHYELLLDNVVAGVSKHIRENRERVSEADKPSVIVAGGTSKPNGFIEMLEARLKKADFGNFKFGDIRRPEGNGVFTVAKGLLIAAETLER